MYICITNQAETTLLPRRISENEGIWSTIEQAHPVSRECDLRYPGQMASLCVCQNATTVERPPFEFLIEEWRQFVMTWSKSTSTRM